MNVNVGEVSDHIETLIRRNVPVDPERLGDPRVPLAALAGAVGAGAR